MSLKKLWTDPPCGDCRRRKAWLIKQASDMKERAKNVLRFRKPGTNAARTVIKKGAA